jgi:CheY-like chemotaxis protein
VVEAASGEAGLRLAVESKPDVITLDVVMPGMDGWAVLTRLKADPGMAEVPVIMLTIVDEKHLGFTLGASEYLTKPIDRQRLTEVVKKYAQSRSPGPLQEQEGWRVTETETLLSEIRGLVKARALSRPVAS